MSKVTCPNCKHVQQTKSKLQRITCSSCGKKFYRIKSSDKTKPINNKDPFMDYIEKEDRAFKKEMKKLKLD